MSEKAVVVGVLRAVVGPPAASPRRAAKVGGEPPEWILIFPFGEYQTDHADAPFLIDEEGMASVVAAFEARGNDLVIDYEHQTLDGDQAPAAGWIKELEARGKDGLWARVEWTEKGANYLRSGEYRYDSPVFNIDKKTKRVTELLNVALTNWPASHNRTALTEQIAAKARAKFETKTASREGVMEGLLQSLKWWLNLKTTTTNNELKAELTKVVNSIPADDQLVYAKADGEPDQTFAEAAGYTPIGAPGEENVEPEIVAAKAVLDELELEEGATLAQVQARIGELKAPAGAVEPTEFERVQNELTAAKAELEQIKATSDEDKLTQLIAANRTKVTPAREPFIRRIAKAHGIEHAKEVIANMREELPKPNAALSDVSVDEPIVASTTHRVGTDELPVSEESATLRAKVEKFQKDNRIASYSEAYRRMKTEKQI